MFVVLIAVKDADESAEVLSMSDLLKKFDLGRIQKAGAIVDEQRLLHLSHCHFLQQLEERPEHLIARLRHHPLTRRIVGSYDDAFVLRVLNVNSDRLRAFGDIAASPFFSELVYARELLNCDLLQSAELRVEAIRSLSIFRELVESLESSAFSSVSNANAMLRLAADRGKQPLRSLMKLFRVGLIGLQRGPGVPSILFAFGKGASLRR
jgi:hypothetical protein